MIKEIAFTIYAVSNIKKARDFYEGVLGLVPSDEFPIKEDSTWIEYNIGKAPNEGTFAIGHAPGQWEPSKDGASVAFEVEDFDAIIAKLKEANCSFKVEPMEFPTCHMAVVLDPDGSSVGIHKRKAK